MKLLKTIIAIVIIAIPVTASAGWFSSTPVKESSNKTEQRALESNQERLINSVPIPTMQDSMERKNIAERAKIFNKSDKISYIYLVNYGKVMAFYTVKGKVSSLRSYMVPQERLVNAEGGKCTYDSSESFCYIVSAPDIDGSYGDNVDGIFFFTTEGAYVEWRGDYMMSDQPLKLTTTPELVREIE